MKVNDHNFKYTVIVFPNGKTEIIDNHSAIVASNSAEAFGCYCRLNGIDVKVTHLDDLPKGEVNESN